MNFSWSACGYGIANRLALQNNGGQALDLLTIALKPDSNKPMHLGIL